MESDHPTPDWPLDAAEDLRDDLLSAYEQPGRGYHDRSHLEAVLARLSELAAAGVRFDSRAVRLAAWFHDAVYDGERDAEERSAAWAEDALPAHVDDATVAEVTRLVRLTETHEPAAEDTNGCALCDADLGVLGAAPGDYDAYAAAVRTDYSHLTDQQYAGGRAAKLEELLGRTTLFHTEAGRTWWDEQARANMARELAGLTAAAH